MSDEDTLMCHLTLNSQNPSVGADCSGIIIGNSYCVEAAECTNDHNNLRRWHLAGSGDDSASVVGRHDTFTLAQFYDWNRAVGTNCAGFWLGYWYCIGEIFTLTPTLIVADLGLCRR
ncbi:lysM domain-containing protein [Colletotrichum tofieldiae]|nr:LysM domain-containing protein [Colletotrichum tofieldiae]GKT68944.1 lysM domain-containing protein [Colletotrichum tofieldiae]